MLLSFQWFWLVLLLYLMSLRDVEAQFPGACTTPEALNTRTCCPLWNGSPCGCRSGRGFCAPHPALVHRKPVDYRVNWPRAFYDSVCTCQGKYDGFDCGQCLPGWKGPDCQTRHHVERKEITDMTDSERENFLSSLDLAKKSPSSRYVILTSNDTTVKGNYEFHNTSVYNLYVWMHYYAAKVYAGTHNDAAHQGPAFPFWHRVFLLFIEREIRDLTGNHDFYIPYWDWTRTDHCNICTNKYFGGVRQDGRIDSASRFSKWKTICPYDESLGIICIDSVDDPAPLIRNPGKDPSSNTLPTAEDVKDTLARLFFDTSPFNRRSRDSFRNTLEGFDIPYDSRHLKSSMHNLVHNYFNGTMSLVPTAANDPIFMVHHSFVDKILEEWLPTHGNAAYPDSDLVPAAQRADAYMAPFFPLRTSSYYWNKNIRSLGYSYRDHSFEIPDDSRHLTTSMHNLVHRYFNGTMSLFPTAANDPIFMVHHSFIDKILEEWLKADNDAAYPDSDLVHPAQTAYAYMAPFLPLLTNNYYWGRDIRSLGYSFREHSLSGSGAVHSIERQAEGTDDCTS